MAEKGAHLTQTLQNRPSLFDYVAQESLDSLLYPSLKKVISILASRNDRLKVVDKWFSEIFYLGHSLLQLHYLTSFCATFSENFYGLKRVSLRNPHLNLTRRDIVSSILFCSVVPYFLQRLDDAAEKYYFEILPTESKRHKILLGNLIIKLNSGLNVCLKLITFVQYLRYLSGDSEIISPYLWASGLKLEYMNEQYISEGSLGVRKYVSKLIRRSLEFTAFFIQFCHWWQRDNMGTNWNLPAPPSPKIRGVASKFAGICPLCKRKRVQETILNVSGFVYCHSCIADYVRVHRRCPVTDLPASINNMIKLYPPQ